MASSFRPNTTAGVNCTLSRNASTCFEHSCRWALGGMCGEKKYTNGTAPVLMSYNNLQRMAPRLPLQSFNQTDKYKFQLLSATKPKKKKNSQTAQKNISNLLSESHHSVKREKTVERMCALHKAVLLGTHKFDSSFRRMATNQRFPSSLDIGKL